MAGYLKEFCVEGTHNVTTYIIPGEQAPLLTRFQTKELVLKAVGTAALRKIEVVFAVPEKKRRSTKAKTGDPVPKTQVKSANGTAKTKAKTTVPTLEVEDDDMFDEEASGEYIDPDQGMSDYRTSESEEIPLLPPTKKSKPMTSKPPSGVGTSKPAMATANGGVAHSGATMRTAGGSKKIDSNIIEILSDMEEEQDDWMYDQRERRGPPPRKRARGQPIPRVPSHDVDMHQPIELSSDED